MRRADRQLQPISPTVVSTRDGEQLSMRLPRVNVERGIGVNLDTLLTDRAGGPQLIEGALQVALELTAIMPRPIMERLVERVIERLDELDGDSDLELINEREPEY